MATTCIHGTSAACCSPSVLLYFLPVLPILSVSPASVWLPPARYWQARLPPLLRAWLLSRGSLTAYLQALSHGEFRVEVVQEGWHFPHADECQALGLPRRHYARIREVALWGQGEVWIQARSVIPLQTLQGKGGRLRYLGTRSLGSLLFRDGGRRDAPEIRRVPQGWQRRSRFYYGGQPLLVQERFLPALFTAAARHKGLKLR